MSGQSAAKSVKEVKNTIKSIETNAQLKGGSGGGKEMGANIKSGSHEIGK